MFKIVALTTRKPGMSFEAYKEYYETRHAVLARQLVPQIVGYKRNFVDHADPLSVSGASGLDFDAITEITYKDRASFEESTRIAQEPEIAKRLAEDEANFLDRSKTRMFVVEERETPSKRP